MEFTEEQFKRLKELLDGVSGVVDGDNDVLVSKHAYNGEEFVITTPECLHQVLKQSDKISVEGFDIDNE